MAKLPNKPSDDSNSTSDDAPGATAFVRLDEAPPPQGGDDAPGATAFVRVDNGQLPPLRKNLTATIPAPKKGLQVRLPDDEPVAPKPKPKAVPPPEKGKGRRGAWWDEQSGSDEEPTQDAAPEEEPPPPSPDDAPGATAFLAAEPPPPPPRRRAPAPPPEEPPPVDDGRTKFFKPGQDVLEADIRARPVHTPEPEPGIPWKQIFIVLGIALLITVLSVVFIYRKDIFRRPGLPPRPAGQAADPNE